jgi:uncharacterized protein
VTSAVYEGTLRHHRRGAPRHSFSRRLAMPYLDLAEIDEVFARHPLWSVERPNAVSFRRADYLGDPDVPLEAAVRDVVAARAGRRPTGPIRMLGHVRTWGWLFNPITVYVCMNATDDRIDALVLEVTNTPWHERHTYVIPGGEGEHRFDKELHVSPFFPMEQEYRLRVTRPGDSLVVHLATLEGETVVFDATLALRRKPIGRSSMSRLLWRYPLLTTRVSLGIYSQAARLWAKGARLHPHPVRTAPAAGPERSAA